MQNRYRFGMLACVTCLAVLCLVLSGCPNPSRPAEDRVNQDAQATEASSDAEASTEAIEDESSGLMEETFGSTRQELTREGLETITAYGPFMFPDAELLLEESQHQLHADGTEIYLLKFGCAVPVSTVADWYSDHIEAGALEESGELPSGQTLAHFSYEAPDRSWTKTVVLTGFEGENRCMVTVNLVGMASPPGEEEEAAESGAEAE